MPGTTNQQQKHEQTLQETKLGCFLCPLFLFDNSSSSQWISLLVSLPFNTTACNAGCTAENDRASPRASVLELKKLHLRRRLMVC